MELKYLETGSHDPCYNLAFEEYVLKNLTEANYLILWQNEPSVIVGLNQLVQAEADTDYAARHGINVVRRSSGGGAVYHDLGNLNYSFLIELGKTEQFSAEPFTRLMCAALEKLDLDVSAGGRNDILCAGKKISGVAQRIHGRRLLYHGTLLYATDIEVMEQVLSGSGAKYSSKGSKSVRSRVANISHLLGEKPDVQAFRKTLLEYLIPGDKAPVRLGADALAEMNALADSKYRSWDWTYGRNPAFTYTAQKKFPAGTLCLGLDVRKGIIEDIGFSGDYMARLDDGGLREALRGLPCRPEPLIEVLKDHPLEDIFGGVTAQELMSLFPS